MANKVFIPAGLMPGGLSISQWSTGVVASEVLTRQELSRTPKVANISLDKAVAELAASHISGTAGTQPLSGKTLLRLFENSGSPRC